MKFSQGGELEWHRSYPTMDYADVGSIRELSDGTFVIVGTKVAPGGSGERGEFDIAVTRLSNGGSPIWTTYFATSRRDNGFDIVETPDGGILATGISDSYGELGFLLWLYRASGRIEKQAVLDSNMYALQIDRAFGDGYVLLHRDQYSSKIVKVDLDGRVVSVHTATHFENATVAHFLPLDDGRIALVGAYRHTGMRIAMLKAATSGVEETRYLPRILNLW
ncbi:MAG: hypothetical protein H7X80_11285 [bacterium]|nr:hypothetical protein [Candidatus Kapabacteria bacterium]